MGGNPAIQTSILSSGGVEIFQVASRDRNRISSGLMATLRFTHVKGHAFSSDTMQLLLLKKFPSFRMDMSQSFLVIQSYIQSLSNVHTFSLCFVFLLCLCKTSYCVLQTLYIYLHYPCKLQSISPEFQGQLLGGIHFSLLFA